MNDIVSRIKYFLTTMGIANSSFADICGIPRPSLSQLLNGRNKKVSNEVIDKIHVAYPELNMMWLMFGDGDMLVPNANSDESLTANQPVDNTFPGNAQLSARDSHQQQSINFDEDLPVSYQQRKSVPSSQRQAASISDAIVAAARGSSQAAKRQLANVGDRRITSVVIIFNDGTTQTIMP